MEAKGIKLRLAQHQPIPLDVEIECHVDELVALVGPSGSGKTTVLRTIAGLHHPESGQILCRDEIWLDRQQAIHVPTQKRHIGFVFQDYALFPHLTALQNVTIAMNGITTGQRASRARELLTQVNLKGLEDRFPGSLSGGQRQRVALARALAREPKILLLDEPFSAVDQVTRRKLQQELAILRRSIRIPILLVTHDLDEAAMLADRLYVLHKGRTLQNGKPIEVQRNPASALVARLMGHSNIFSATVEGHYPAEGITRISWRGRLLELELSESFAVGSTVNWVIHPSHIIMHRRDRPSFGERENPVHGVISEFLELGENAFLRLETDGDDEAYLNFTVSSHSAQRNNLSVGARAGVSLLANGIHLMPEH